MADNPALNHAAGTGRPIIPVYILDAAGDGRPRRAASLWWLDKSLRALTGRQLWTTGWMHNRVRMITASFLIKDLLIDWRRGESWFWDTLADADLASNVQNWQWVAGSGADAAPYFRILSPVSQGQKFDADGRYVRKWVPELARLPDRWLHAPWTAPAESLRAAGVQLGDDYPHPVIDHAAARLRALGALKTVSAGAAEAVGD